MTDLCSSYQYHGGTGHSTITVLGGTCHTNTTILDRTGTNTYQYKYCGGVYIQYVDMSVGTDTFPLRINCYLRRHVSPYRSDSPGWEFWPKCGPFFEEKNQSLRVTKPDKIDLIFQLILAHWVLGTLETP